MIANISSHPLPDVPYRARLEESTYVHIYILHIHAKIRETGNIHAPVAKRDQSIRHLLLSPFTWHQKYQDSYHMDAYVHCKNNPKYVL